MDSLPWPTHLFLVSISHLFPLPFLLCGDFCSLYSLRSFPGRSAGKESACNAGDPVSVPGLGRSPGEGMDYPFRYSWASLVAQMVKNLLAMWQTCFRSRGWENSLEKVMATCSSTLAWRIPKDEGAWWATVHGVTKGQMQLNTAWHRNFKQTF